MPTINQLIRKSRKSLEEKSKAPALKKLDKENVVVLDDDKKAAMVSNLMVVLCSESATQPVVNSGTLNM